MLTIPTLTMFISWIGKIRNERKTLTIIFIRIMKTNIKSLLYKYRENEAQQSHFIRIVKMEFNDHLL